MQNRIIQPAIFILILPLLIVHALAPAARAGMIATETMVTTERHEALRTKVARFLDRQEVRSALEAYGVEPAEAQNRLDTLTDQEVQQLAGVIDQMPAGGDGLGMIIGAGLLVFFVLLITDLLGLTHVYPFVNR